jgi:glycosyltransferase involved in cell wall biosynthesis/ribosomal protein S18 acetylase RimI-like enzyme
MRVLYLTYYFPPEIGTGPHLPYELCESLVKLGHDVSVVTGFPRYHVEAMPSQYRGHFLYAEEIDGVKVYRINAPNAYTKLRYLRGFVQQIVPWVLAVRAICLKNKPDIVYTQTPPLTMGLAARFVAKRFGVPCVVNVQDLFPQCVIDLGMLKNRTLIRIFEWIERGIYKKSNLITVMSEGNRNFVIERGGSPDRTIVAPNWVDVDLIQPGERMNDFRRIHGLGNKFVALFAGTMGWSQGIGTVVEAARCLVHQTDVVFLIVGDGVEKKRLMKQAEGLPNVRFLPMQTKAVYPQVLAASNVSLVTLRPEVATPTFPSKICTIMAAGRPIVASIPPIEDAPRLITETDCGLVVPAADPKALADAVLTLKNDEERVRQMGLNGRMYVEKYLARSICVRQNEELFQFLTGEKQSLTPQVTAKKAPLPVDIRPARTADLDAIVEIHLAAFHQGHTLVALGPVFLRTYYELLLHYAQEILLVAENNGKIEGFVAGFVDPKNYYKMLKNNIWRLSFAAIRSIPKRPKVAFWLFRAVRRGLQFMSRPETQKENFCELASMAVRPVSMRCGVGKVLVRAFLDRTREMGVAKVYLTTDAKNNDATNNFYLQLGFQLADVFQTPRGRRLNEFIMLLQADDNSLTRTGDAPSNEACV